MNNLYFKDGEIVLVDNCNRFIYEVYVSVKFDNIYSIVDHKYFSSDKEILNIVKKYKVDKYIDISCELYSAPINWLEDNEYFPYVKPIKVKRNGNRKKNLPIKS